MRVAIIPSHCPKFVAACATAGVELENKAKGISNAYSKDRKYDPDEPGTISYFLSEDQGLGPVNLAKVWINPKHDLEEYAQITDRLKRCRSMDDWHAVADDIEALSLTCAFANMSLFASNKTTVDSSQVSAEETLAAELLDKLPNKMRLSQPSSAAKVAEELSRIWEPAMFAWIKAFIANYLELKNIWKVARPSLKIEREDSPFPLIIPQGKDTRKLLRRWA